MIGPDPVPANCLAAGGVSDFGATLVGFGGAADMRNYRYSEDWARSGQSGGAMYQNAWMTDGSYPGASESGDSGGALLRNGTLCAVDSGHTWGGHWEWVGWWPFEVPVWVPMRYTNTAAVDSTEAQTFLRQIRDQDGRLMGECFPNEGPAHLRDVDSDGDLLPDACDPCPNVEDPRYRSTGAVRRFTDPRTGEMFGPGCCAPSYRSLAGYTPALELADRDGDRIPDLCDTCVNDANLEQTEGVEPDLDGDSIPDKCDNCAGVATVVPGVDQRIAHIYPEGDDDGDEVGNVCDWCTGSDPADRVFEQELHDCNFEAELAMYYAGRTTVPLVVPGANYNADLATYKAAFQIGTCDVACPKISLGDGAFPEGQEPLHPCIPPNPGACAYVMRNGITHTPTPSPTTVGALATTHTKWCDCPTGDMETLQGRVACQQAYGCRPIAGDFTHPRWLDIRTASEVTEEDAVDWTTAGPEIHSLHFWGLPQGPTIWDFQALGAPYVKDSYTSDAFDPAAGNTLNAYVNGMLWSNIRSGFGITPNSPEESRLQERGSYVETGAANSERRSRIYILDDPFEIDPNLTMPCYDCGMNMGVSDLVLVSPGPDDLDRSALIVTPSGVREARGALSSAAMDALFSSQALEQTVIPAAEPVGLLAQLRPGQSSMRAVVVADATGAPVLVLKATGVRDAVDASHVVEVDRPVDKSSNSTLPRPGPLDQDEGVVLTAEHQRMYRFGGKAHGNRRSAWTFDFHTHQWTETKLHAGSRPGRVLASTYRRDDNAVYEVDRSTVLTRLRRWVPGSLRFETVAKWPSPWRSFSRYWLVNGQNGDLFLVGSRDTLSMVARFSPGANGSLEFKGMRLLNERIVAIPVTSRTHIAFAVSAPGDSITGGGLRQESIPIDSIGGWLTGWCPELGDEQ